MMKDTNYAKLLWITLICGLILFITFSSAYIHFNEDFSISQDSAIPFLAGIWLYVWNGVLYVLVSVSTLVYYITTLLKEFDKEDCDPRSED